MVALGISYQKSLHQPTYQERQAISQAAASNTFRAKDWSFKFLQVRVKPRKLNVIPNELCPLTKKRKVFSPTQAGSHVGQVYNFR